MEFGNEVVDALAGPEEEGSSRLGGVDCCESTRAREFDGATPAGNGVDCGRRGEPKARVEGGRGGVEGRDG